MNTQSSFGRARRKSPVSKRRQHRRLPLSVESLESRNLLSTFVFPSAPNNNGTPATYLSNLTDLGEILGSSGAANLPATYTDTSRDELVGMQQFTSVEKNGGGLNLIPPTSNLVGMYGDMVLLKHVRPNGSGGYTTINDIDPLHPLVFHNGDILYFGAANRNPLLNPGVPGSGGYLVVSDDQTGFAFDGTGNGSSEDPHNLILGSGGFTVTSGGSAVGSDNFSNAPGQFAVDTAGHIVLAGRFQDFSTIAGFVPPSAFSVPTAALLANAPAGTIYAELGTSPVGIGPDPNVATQGSGFGYLDVVGGTSLSSFQQNVTYTNANTVGGVPLGGPTTLVFTIESQFNTDGPSDYTQFQSSSSDPVNYVGATPDVDVTKTADAATVNAGQSAGFTVTLTNEGGSTATGVTLSDPLPAGLGNDVNWSINGGANAGAFQITGAVGSQTLKLNPSGISLAAGASLTVHITGVTSANDTNPSTFTGTLVNTATVNATNESSAEQNDHSTATVTVLAPDVDVTKTADAATVNAGQNAGFTVTIHNDGQGFATGVSLNDPLPAGAGNDISWAIDGGANSGAFIITDSAGSQVLKLSPQGVTLAAGGSLAVHISGTVSAADAGTLTNTATVTGTNETTAETTDTATASVNVTAPDVDVTKTADTATVNAGQSAGFTITVHNDGNGAGTGVSLNDPLPAGSGDISWAIDGGANSGAFTITGPAGSQVLKLSPQGVTLAAGGSLAVHISGTVSAADAGTLVNTATVTGTNETTAETTDTATASVNVTAPDVDVTKTADAATVNAGQSAGFTITVHNDGNGAATGVGLNDPLPAGSGDISWAIDGGANAGAFTITGSAGSQTLVLSPSGVTLAAGGSLAVHISGTVSAADAGTLVNTATVTGTNETTAETTDTATASVNVTAPDVDVTKTADSGTVNAGQSAGFTVTIHNDGNGAGTGVTLNDPLPAGAGSDVSWSIDGGANSGAFTITGPAGSQVLKLSPQGVTLAAGGSLAVHISGTVSAADAGTLTNTATVTGTNETTAETTDTATASVNVTAPDVDVSKTADQTTVNAGDTVGFTVMIFNEGNGAATGVSLSDALPAGSAGDVTWSIDGGANSGAFTITGSAGSQVLGLSPSGITLAAGGTLTVHIKSSPIGAGDAPNDFTGSIVNTATVTGTNETTAETTDTSSATVPVTAPDVDVTKTADAATVNAGQSAGFTITVFNEGSGAATGVSLNDPLPAGSGDISWAIDGGANAGAFTITGSAGSQTLVLSPSGVTLAAGGSLAVHISGTVSAADAGTLTNTATVTGSNETTAETTDTATASVNVTAPDVDVTKTADSGTVNAGQSAGFTITVHNDGNGAATGVGLNDPLPAGSGDISWAIDGGANAGAFTITGSAGSQTLVLSPSGVTLAAGGSLAVHISGTVSAADAGTLTNTATVTGTNETTAETTDTATASVNVTAPDVDVTKTADSGTVNAGQSTGFTITVHNDGNGAATGVGLNDPLPAGSGDISWAIDGGANAGAFTITGSAGSQTLVLSPSGVTLAAGGSLAVHISGTVSAADAGTLTNTATVTGSNETTAETTDTATASVNVTAPDVDVTKTADSGTVNAGQSTGFTITVHNDGNGAATGVGLNDPLPAGSGDISWAIDGGANAGAFTITGSAGSQTLVLSPSGVTLAAGGSLAVHISGTVSAADAGTLTNTATVTGSNETTAETTDTATATTNVTAPDVDVSKTADIATINVGQSAGFTVTITNDGNGAATGVTLSDPLPAGMGNDVTWAIDGGANAGAFQITGSAGSQSLVLNPSGITLGAGDSLTVHISGTATTFHDVSASTFSGTLPNTATVNATNETTAEQNDHSSATVTVVTQPASISGYVYNDTNDNAVKNAGETGIPNVTVTLTGTDNQGNPVSASTTTDSNGFYQFTGLFPGTYSVSEGPGVPATDIEGLPNAAGNLGGTSASDSFTSISATPGAAGSNYNFGEVPPAAVNGYVYVDTNDNGVKDSGEAGIPNVTVTLSGTDDRGNPVSASTTTDSNGFYQFTGLLPSNASGYTVSEGSGVPATYIEGQNNATGSFGGTAATDTFTGLAATSGNTGAPYNFGEVPPSAVNGHDYLVSNTTTAGSLTTSTTGLAIPGTTVTLTGSDDRGNSVNLSTTTDSNGFYQFTNLLPSNGAGYTVTETPPATDSHLGQTSTTSGAVTTPAPTPVVSNIVLTPGGASSTDNFFETATVSISGTDYLTPTPGSTTPSGVTIAGTTVKLTGTDAFGNAVSQTTTTNGSGFYQFTGLNPSNSSGYTVTETPPATDSHVGQTTNTAGANAGSGSAVSTIVLTSNGASSTDNFFETATVSINGSDYLVASNVTASSLTTSTTGAAIPGTTVKLTGTDVFGNAVSQTTTTNGSGFYQFTGLNPSNGSGYTVTETPPASDTHVGQTSTTSGAVTNTPPGTPSVVSTIVLTTNGASSTDNFFEMAYDLAIKKTADVSALVPGQDNTVHYTIVVSNSGPSTAVNQTVTDTLSGIPGLVSDSWTTTVTGGDSVTTASGNGDINDTVTLVAGAPASANVTFTVTAIIHPAASATAAVSNTATVSADNPNSTPADNTSTVTIPLTPQSDLRIKKTDNVGGTFSTSTNNTTGGTTSPGGTVVYTIVVTNDGPSTAVNAPVSDVMPSAISSDTWSGTDGSSGSGNISDTIPSLAPGASVTYTVNATVSASAGSTTTTADFSTVGSDNTSLGAQSVTVNGITASAYYLNGGALNGSFLTTNTTLWERDSTNEHGLGILSNGESASGGGDVTEISNQQNLEVMRVQKPAGNTWSSLWVSSLDSGGSGGQEMGTLYWSNSPTPDLSTLGSSSFTFKFGDFGAAVEGNVLSLAAAAGFDATANYVFFRAGPNPSGTNNDYLFWKATTATPGGSLVNTANVNWPAANGDNTQQDNTSTDTITFGSTQVDLAVTKTDGTTTYTPGTSTTYTIVVSNNGPSAVTGATVFDAMPAGVTSETWTAVASSGASVAMSSGTGNISTSVSLVPGATVTFTDVVQISPSATGNLVNTVTVTPPMGVTDTNPNNNTATDTDTPTPKADLAITKTDGTTTYTPGGSTTYTIVVSNNGPSAVTAAPVVDNMPAAITSDTWTAVASSGASVASGSGSGNINTTVNLVPGATVTFTVVAQISASAGSTTKTSDFSTVGSDNTSLGAQSVTANGVTASAYYLSGGALNGSYLTTNTSLWERNSTNEHGLGVLSNGENSSGGGDVTELSNQQNLEVIRLQKAVGDTWTSLWVSSLDSGGSGGQEMGTLYWSNSPTPDLSTLGSSSFTFKFGDFGAAVEGNVLSLAAAANFNASANYVFFRAGPNPNGTNNDYLVWKATTATPGNLVNTATVSAPAGVTDTNPNNNSATDTDTPVTQVDLAVTKTDGTTTYVPGTSTTYTIVVSNNGPGAVSNATVMDAMPSLISSETWTAVASSGASVAQASGTGNISTSVSLVPGATVTFTVVAQISSSATGNLVNTVTVTPPNGVTDTNPNNNTATDTDTPAPGSISGHKYLDVTGNGQTADDTGMGGVTIYLDANNNGQLDSGETSTVTAADGSYQFNGLSAGTYIVREVVPNGFVRTGPTLQDYYSVTVNSNTQATGIDFTNAEVCDQSIVSNISYKLNNSTTVSDLRGNTHQGDKVTVTFTVTLPAGMTSHDFSLVSYTAPGATFDANTASQQRIYESATAHVTKNGTYTLTVLDPNCYYQVDFVCGLPINQFGPAGSNIFYSAQGRLFSADNEGTQACSTSQGISTGDFGAPSFWSRSSSGQTLIKCLNGGSSATQLASWLATTFPNLYGSSAGSHSLVNSNGTYFTNSQVASAFTSKFSGGDQQVLATALSVYATSSYLAGTSAASSYGLHVTADGSGGDNYSVGSNGAAFGVANNTKMAVMQLLEAINNITAAGAGVSAGANTVFTGINTAGHVNAADLVANGVAYGPAQVRTAYGVNNLALDGTGQTIAIVDAYDNPAVYQGLDAFDSQFGTTAGGATLYDQYGPASSFLTVVGQNGDPSSLPATDPAGAGVANWELESALDVQWVHAMAPGAQIILVEANSPSLDDLMSAVGTAANLPSVSVVSMSWGFVEGLSVVGQDEALYDSYLTTPAGHQGVTFVASTGDYGASVPQYPAFSPNVVAVGGTSLHLNGDNSYNSEAGWGAYASDGSGTFFGSGGGVSQFEAQPAFQQGVQSTGFRTTPDVSFVADPSTGAWVADPYNVSGDNPWVVVGGTSLSAPAWAGLLALANQGRANAGENTLGSAGPTEAQTALYSVPQADYNAVTTGYNGYSAGAGYNLVTGLGTPVADALVNDLIAYNDSSLSATPAGQQPISAANLTMDPNFAASGATANAVTNAQANAFASFNAELSTSFSGFRGVLTHAATGLTTTGLSLAPTMLSTSFTAALPRSLGAEAVSTTLRSVSVNSLSADRFVEFSSPGILGGQPAPLSPHDLGLHSFLQDRGTTSDITLTAGRSFLLTVASPARTGNVVGLESLGLTPQADGALLSGDPDAGSYDVDVDGGDGE